jgi:hypothetical protein
VSKIKDDLLESDEDQWFFIFNLQVNEVAKFYYFAIDKNNWQELQIDVFSGSVIESTTLPITDR